MIVLMLCSCFALFSQTKIDETFDPQQATTIKLDFKWPELIRLSSWDGTEVKIMGTAMINNGEHDEAFRIRSSLSGGVLNIYSEIENFDDLPKRITVKKDGMVYYFNTDDWHDPEVQKFIHNDEGGTNEYVSMGVVKEIKLDVQVPKDQQIMISSKYGLLEVKNLKNDLDANSKYGGIDITVEGDQKALKAKTRYGEIYSNLPRDLKSEGDQLFDRNKWVVVGSEGNSGFLHLESKYGNVFLRKKE